MYGQVYKWFVGIWDGCLSDGYDKSDMEEWLVYSSDETVGFSCTENSG